MTPTVPSTKGGLVDPTCPGCGSTEVLPGRVFCRPSCKARYEHRERQRAPALPLDGELDSEWQDEGAKFEN